MKVSLKTNILIPEKDMQKSEMEVEPGTTLGTALLELCRGTDMDTIAIVDEEGKVIRIDDMWEVQINGRACYVFPEDFDHPLRPGDELTLWLTPLGGG
jgi:hypothetical protein